MSIKDVSAATLAESFAKRAPCDISGDAAAVCAALAVGVGGGASQPKLTTIKFGSPKNDAEPAPRDRCAELAARLFELADADAEAEGKLRLAYRKPAMLPGESEEKAKAVLDAQREACNVTLNIMRAAGEAAEIIIERARDDSDLVRSGAAAGLALCAGAIWALEAEACSRAAKMEDPMRAQSVVRCAEELCEKYAAAAQKTQEELTASLRRAVRGD